MRDAHGAAIRVFLALLAAACPSSGPRCPNPRAGERIGDVVPTTSVTRAGSALFSFTGLHVIRVSLDTGTQETLASSDPPFGPPDVVVTDAEVLWTAGQVERAGAVFAVPLVGGAVRVVAGQQTRPGSLRGDARSVYWSAIEAPDGVVVRTAPTAGGDVATILLGQGNDLIPAAVDDGRLYFAQIGKPDFLGSMARDGSATVTRLALGRLDCCIDLVADRLVWAARHLPDGPELRSTDVNSGSTMTIRIADERPKWIGVDARGGYTFESSHEISVNSYGDSLVEDAGILRNLQTGRQIACVEQASAALAIDDRYVYWNVGPPERPQYQIYPNVPTFTAGLYRVLRSF